MFQPHSGKKVDLSMNFANSRQLSRSPEFYSRLNGLSAREVHWSNAVTEDANGDPTCFHSDVSETMVSPLPNLSAL